MKGKRKIIFSSVLTAALSASLIAGSTFALFTSESEVNIAVTSAKVDVNAKIEESTIVTDTVESELLEGKNEAFTANYQGGTLSIQNMAAGDYVTFHIVVTNDSTINVKYRTTLTLHDGIVNGEEYSNLFGDLEVLFGGETSAYDGSKIVSKWQTFTGDLDENEKPTNQLTIPVTVSLPATSKATGAACTLSFGVEAVQGNAEVVDYVKITKQWGLGDKIDRPLRDYEFKNIFARENDDKFYILNEDGFIELMKSLSDDVKTLNNRDDRGDSIAAFDGSWFHDKYNGTEFVVTADLDFKDVAWENVSPDFKDATWSAKAAGITIDFNNHTIRNLSVDNPAAEGVGLFGAASLLTVKNLVIDHADVTGNQYVGILFGHNFGGSCVADHVIIQNSTVTGKKYVGGFSGYTAGTIRDCRIADCTLKITEGGSTVGCLSGFQKAEAANKYVTNNKIEKNIVIGARAGILFGQVQTTVALANISGNTFSGNTINGVESARLVGTFYDDTGYHGKDGEDVSEQIATYLPNQH